MKTPIYFITLLLLVALIICGNKPSKPISSGNDDFKLLVNSWNKAHSAKGGAVLSALYSNSVLYYGKQKDKAECIKLKLSLFQKQPDFLQQIVGEISTERVSDNEVKCNFTKRVTVNRKTKDYPSYLQFKKIDGRWKIVIESDLVTDKNLAGQKKGRIPKEAVKGDFNGDGTPEYAWLVAPKIKENEMKCIGDCNSYIKFSDTSIPDIKIENCIGGRPDNLGDLNNDRKDEIGLLPEWFTSCWKGYFVWTLKNNRWIYAVNPISTHCNQWEQGVKPIEIDLKHKGYVLIRYSEMTDNDIVTKTKSVPIK